jgi:hypothetical protein
VRFRTLTPLALKAPGAMGANGLIVAGELDMVRTVFAC